jgi:hypothetical protein
MSGQASIKLYLNSRVTVLVINPFGAIEPVSVVKIITILCGLETPRTTPLNYRPYQKMDIMFIFQKMFIKIWINQVNLEVHQKEICGNLGIGLRWMT